MRYLDRAGDGSPDGPLARQSIEVEILVQPIVLMLDPSTDNKRDRYVELVYPVLMNTVWSKAMR